MRQQDVHDELRARLQEAAGQHEPDRARILARVERGMAGQTQPDHRATRPPALGWVRVVSATAAVACVLGLGGYAVASAVKDDAPEQTVATTATPEPSPDATTRAPIHPSASQPGETRRTEKPRTTPTAKAPSATAKPPVTAPGAEDGPLWSDGAVDPHSNDFWAQSNLTLKTSEELTALTVRLKIAQTGGVASTGAWRTLPEDDFTLTTEEQDGFLVYTWTLKEGRKVPQGEWVFAGQYNKGRDGRDAGDDAYTATGTAGGAQLAVKGDFTADNGSS
ncbi:hypothetical protein SAMN06272735_1999 [Streptomyces sp. TLI_55]|uniref:hypothetical protein n=1 Tax=Streptomyces sp. TLI_55 TaxID=1938861 RepID=UPI000BC4724A|nr:hypothetical protein [Streptomyces sp. TLI_55]SNX57528.1 hypothetical protein SAMN06272735_1999 [Streptomyces sp. TLI_55]